VSEESYELVMPFVVVASKGGLYDDESYTAGWEACGFWCLLADVDPAVGLIEPPAAVRTDNVPQIDLIAMKFGWTMTTSEYGDGWSQVSFRR
jgi:hypothetical protein